MPEDTTLRQQLEPVLKLLTEGAASGEWRKCVITPAKANSSHVPWQKFVAQPVRLSRGPAIKLVTQVGRNESTTTVELDRWPDRLEAAIEAGPCHLDVLARDHDWHGAGRVTAAGCHAFEALARGSCATGAATPGA